MTVIEQPRNRAASAASGVGDVVALIASGRARTRAALVQIMGLSRSTISQRLDVLFNAGLVHESTETLQSGGRPAKTLVLNKDFGVIAAVDIGEQHVRVALTDMSPTVLVERTAELDIHTGPETVLQSITSHIKALFAEIDRPTTDLLGIGLGLPAPVDFAASRVVGFSVLTGWDGFDIAGWFARDFDAPVLADNDVNLLALAEHRRNWPTCDYLFYVKAGNGIGSGIVTRGLMYRGAQGAAGDIGHTAVRGHGDPLCRCGNAGCVEALAAGWALVRDLRAAGFGVNNAADVVALAERGQPEAIRELRKAGRILGEAIANATSLLNPGVIVVGGVLSLAGDYLLAGVREVVYQRTLPLATRQLQITGEHLDERGGVLGATQLVLDNALEPTNIERMLERLGQVTN
ncbi:ROK family transcriptional regulator [Micromonospora costi]|uniref:ROK family transcriptional regulator n=1 Tax=Micromonospora costi TaxID=1530042 RepID=UPI001319CA4E|nr:ROK family transcriptional regulator [Micromonospora costi]